MQAAALEKSTADNYEGHWKKFVKFCTEENLRWLPATAATVQLYMAALQKSELEKLRRLPYCPYAPVNPFPPRPDTLTDLMPKLFDLYGDKTHAALSKKSNSSMKYEQMVLGPALAYFHDAIVYEYATVDLLQNVPDAEYTPFLAEL
ncbi:hypothetical protein CYMTET_39631 [Cymbomonas tetramitiformis]|uniref:Uncharacterized protein n=1 Tax=Cymbomonas tetramitiformis TaxID=36881 RepID=A0AAE0F5F1_9CHLO|nr:hypothetical protein CYMTET_39631 [Cymbomonas tetramitiformis]